NSDRLFQLTSDQMQAVRRSGGHDRIHRMILQIRLQPADRRLHPPNPRIGNEQVAAQPQRKILLPTFRCGLAQERGLQALVLLLPAGLLLPTNGRSPALPGSPGYGSPAASRIAEDIW